MEQEGRSAREEYVAMLDRLRKWNKAFRVVQFIILILCFLGFFFVHTLRTSP